MPDASLPMLLCLVSALVRLLLANAMGAILHCQLLCLMGTAYCP